MLENKFGMSLIEMMIALLLSTLILSFLVGMYLSIYRSHQTIVAMRTIEENELLAFEILNAAVSKAGYIGCAKLTASFPFVNHTNQLFTAANKINYINKNHINGFTVRYMDQDNTVLVKDMRGYSTLYVSKNRNINSDDTFIISNCQSAEMFQVKDVVKEGDNLKITTQTPLVNRYEKNALFGQYKEESYFVDDGALWVKDLTKKNEIVRGVENMQVVFAIGDNGKMVMVSNDMLPNEKRGIQVIIQWFSPEIELHHTGYGFFGLKP